MAYKLIKPCTELEIENFKVAYNHNMGLRIEETPFAFYALEPNEMMENNLPVVNPNYEQELRNIIGLRHLTRADVKRGIYKTRKITFNDIILQLKKAGADIDFVELEIELDANHFYRGNPYVEQIGTFLGYTQKQLDDFFLTGNPEDLIKEEVTEETV